MDLRKTFEPYIPEQITWRKNHQCKKVQASGLTNLFESIIEEEKYVEKKLTEKEDNVIIRSRESMHYYEILRDYTVLR